MRLPTTLAAFWLLLAPSLGRTPAGRPVWHNTAPLQHWHIIASYGTASACTARLEPTRELMRTITPYAAGDGLIVTCADGRDPALSDRRRPPKVR